jgi:hypothetical protein
MLHVENAKSTRACAFFPDALKPDNVAHNMIFYLDKIVAL